MNPTSRVDYSQAIDAPSMDFVLRLRTTAAALGITLVLTSCGGNAESVTIGRSPDAATTSDPSTTSSSVTTTPTSAAAAPSAPPPVREPVPEPAGPALAPTAEAASPDELASRVVAAETIARDPQSPIEDVRSAAFELQLLYRQLARTPDWDGPVLTATPPQLQLTVTSNNAARREFRSMHSKLSDTLPAWRIIDPVPADELLSYYQEGEATFGVPWEILAAVNLVETGMGRIRGTSVAGAQGPMQFMPATWAAFGDGGDINDTHDAIMGAARYLAHNGGGSGNIDGALWNYNHSNKYVRGVKHYAAVMTEDPQAFHGFYHWQIVYLSSIGDIWMPNGYESTERLTVTDYLAANPTHHLTTATN